MGSRRQVGAGAMTRPHFLVVLLLLACVHARVVRRETNSLIEAAQEGNLERVRRLVSDAHAPDVNEIGPDDRTPLIFAASFGDPAIVHELVQAGALVDFQDSFGWSPLHWAADTGLEPVALGRLSRQHGLGAGAGDGRGGHQPHHRDGQEHEEAVHRVGPRLHVWSQ